MGSFLYQLQKSKGKIFTYIYLLRGQANACVQNSTYLPGKMFLNKCILSLSISSHPKYFNLVVENFFRKRAHVCEILTYAL